MKCKCGNEFDTSFCPQCGGQHDSPTLSLLSYLAVGVQREEGKIREMEIKIVESLTPEAKKFPIRELANAQGRKEKWSSWHKALLDLVSEKENKDARALKEKR